MSLTMKELNLALESSFLEGKLKRTIEIVLASANDWPKAVLSLEDYETEVRRFLGDDVLKQNVSFCLNQIDLQKNAWEAESLYQLMDVFEVYDEGTPLRFIVKDISGRLRKLGER